MIVSVRSDAPASLFSRILAAASTCFFVVFLSAVLAAMLPIKAIDPAWQLGVTSSIVNNGGFALIGLLLLHFAAHLEPGKTRWQARCITLRQWAIPATIGFLLIVPLHGYATWKGLATAEGSSASQQQQVVNRFAELRQAITTAPSAAEIQNRLQQLQGPDLEPGDLSRPLPQLRQQLLVALEKAESGVKASLPVLDPAQKWALLQDSVRVGLSALAFAFAFGTAAMRPKASKSLLVELAGAWSHWRKARPNSATDPKAASEKARKAREHRDRYQRKLKEVARQKERQANEEKRRRPR